MAGISFDGLASGLNTSEIIANVLLAERQMKIAPLQRQEAVLTAKQAAWRDVRSGLAALESKLLDLKLPGTYNSMKVASSHDDVVKATAKAGSAPVSYTVKVEQLAAAKQMWSSKVGAESTLGAGDGTISINGVEIDYKEGGNVVALAQKINDAMKDVKDAGIKVSASVVDGRLVLKAAKTGRESDIELGGDEAGQAIWLELGLANTGENGPIAGYPVDIGKAYGQDGQDAVFYVDGIKIEHSSNKMEDVIAGVTLELTGLSQKTEGGSGWEGYEATKLTVTQDTDKAIKAVKAFVDEYNRVFTANKDKQAWDDDNKQGAILFGDSSLNGIQYRLRGLVTGPVDGADGAYKILAQVGITTGKIGTGVSADGTLHLDEAKLREALAEDPEAVAALFVGENGVAGRLDGYLKETLTKEKNGLLTGKDESFTTQIKDVQKQTQRMEERLERREESLRRQYVQLEKMLAEIQAQSSWLVMQLDGLMGNNK